MNRQTPVNKKIVDLRTNRSLSEYLQECIDAIESLPNRNLLDGLGELVNPEWKNFIRTKLRTEILTLLKFYKGFPIM
jgi:hypothetical protein